MLEPGPGELVQWERVLQSQVAIALLLLLVIAVLVRWLHVVYREQREVDKEFRDYLKSQASLDPLLEYLRKMRDLDAKPETEK